MGIVVINGIIGLAGLWMLVLIIDTFELRRRGKEISTALEVDTLRADLNSHLAGTETETETETETSATVLERFWATTGVQGDGPIGRHLAAVLEAGWHNTKFDVSALIALSTQRLLRTTAFLQTILGLFLVIGLFGTLFGLRRELPELEGLIAGQAEARAQSLDAFLTELAKAFEPSLWGVGVTAVGILLMAVRGRLVTTALQHRLESATLMVWVPAFLPNAPQQLDRILQRIAQQVETSGATVKEVDGLTTRLQERSSEWLEIVEVATAQMKEMGATADRFATATTQFGDGVTRFESAEDTLSESVREFSTENKALHTWLKSESDRAAAVQTTVLESIRDQRDTLTEAFNSLKAYEAEYISQRSAIEDAIKKSVEASTHVLTTSEAQATKIVTELGDPLKTELVSLNETTEAGLGTIATRLKELDAPLNTATIEYKNAIHKTQQNFETANKKVADEFRKQNKLVTDQNQLTKVQAAELVKQRKTFDELLRATNKLVDDQSSQWKKLLVAIEKLSKQLQRVTVISPLKAVKDLFTSGSKRDTSSKDQ